MPWVIEEGSRDDLKDLPNPNTWGILELTLLCVRFIFLFYSFKFSKLDKHWPRHPQTLAALPFGVVGCWSSHFQDFFHLCFFFCLDGVVLCKSCRNLTRDTQFDGHFDILVATIKRSIELTGPISQDRIIQILVGTNQ
jgi:hypothetical protein